MTRNEQIVDLAERGESQKEIAERFGIAQQRVSQIVIPVLGRHHGCPRYSYDRAAVIQAVASGQTYGAVARRFGITRGAVAGIINRHA